MAEMSERTVCLKVAYDGSAYHGFQRQANAMTIQQVLEERLAKIFGHPLTISGAARTDTGVHAYGQVVTFKSTGPIPISRVTCAARSVLPDDIVIHHAKVVSDSFHARLSAKSKIYYYRIYNNQLADPILRHYVWHIRRNLDVENMQQGLKHIIGKHDFSAFRGINGPPVNPVREILHAECRRDADMVEFVFHGTGFLYHMVRNLVGTLANVGLHKTSPDAVREIRESRDRRLAGATAPPNGLYLKEVFYE